MNDFLTKIGVRDDPNCSFCNDEQEKLFHLFWSCPKVVSFWHDLTVRLTLLHITSEHYAIEPIVALGLKPDSSKNYQQINFSRLLARNYIWMSKRNETVPKVEGFLQYLKSIFDVEATAQTTYSPQEMGFFNFDHIILVSLFSYQCFLIPCTFSLHLTLGTFALQSLPFKKIKTQSALYM